MAAQSDKPFVNPLSMTADEMGEVIRGERPDPEHPQQMELDLGDGRREPDVITDEVTTKEPTKAERPQSDKSDTSQEDDPVKKALSTISSLEREIENLKRDRELDRRSTPTATTRSEPEVEMIEFQGVRIPKDRSKRAIQLTKEMMEAVEIDPSVGPGLEILANAMLERYSQIIGPVMTEQIETRLRSREEASKGTESFFKAYPDLVGQEDLLEVVEMRARTQDLIHNRLRGEDYTKEIATRTRSRLASYRGQTLEEYEAALERETPSISRPASTPSRASVTPSRRTPSRAPVSNIQKELDEIDPR